MKKFEDGMVLTNEEFFACTYNKEKCITCPCGKLFGSITLDVDTELECEECGTLITFEPVAWRVCMDR
jgi:hypothetical protein